MDLYNSLKDAGVQIENHESDLYAKVSETSRSIINAAYHRGDVRTVSTFKDSDGSMWYEVPFAYTPFWDTGGSNERQACYSAGL